MKHLLPTTIAAVLLLGWGESQQSVPPPESKPVAEAVKPELPPAPEPPPVTSIHKAVELGSLEDVKQHLADGVNAKDKLGWTPLLWAAGSGHKEIAELLIANGADVNAKRSDGGTSLGWAIGRNHTEIADLLRKHGGKTGAELKTAGNPTEPVAEAAKPEPTTAKAPRISIHEAAGKHGKGNIEAVK